MVLCKFFQQGACRFGSKCVNEHLDIKNIVKTDVEAAINFKQWPLSTYGPFKDRPSIPNFIEDQSFEEVRMLCYEAKQKNFFNQFHQQFNKEALEATDKMKALLQMTPNILDVLISVYDTPSDTSSCGATVGKTTSNPFGLAASTATNAGSIFGKPTTNAPANNIFVGNNNTSFTTTSQGASGIFTNSSAFSNPPQQQQGSIFSQPKPSNSIFAVGSNTSTQQNNSIFAQQQAQTNAFVGSTQQQQTMPAASALFSQQNQFLQTQQNNIFRQAAQTSQSQQGLFAQTAHTLQQQPTQQQGIFAQAVQQTSAPGQGIFAQAAQQTQNIFNQAFHQQHQQPTSNAFQQSIPNSGSQEQQTNSNIFQQNPPITAQPQIQQPPPSGLFQQAALQAQHNAGQMSLPTQVSTTLYSRLENLTADEIEAFKADCFLPGKIPFNPPPKELII